MDVVENQKFLVLNVLEMTNVFMDRMVVRPNAVINLEDTVVLVDIRMQLDKYKQEI